MGFERLINGLRDRIKQLGEIISYPLPTQIELKANFPHNANCSRTLPLRVTVLQPPGFTGFGLRTEIGLLSLSCDECKREEIAGF